MVVKQCCVKQSEVVTGEKLEQEVTAGTCTCT